MSGEGRGTTFLIGSVNRVIPAELDAENREQDYSFRRLLLGFVDPVFSKVITDFKVSFKVWNAGSFVGFESDECSHVRGIRYAISERYDNRYFLLIRRHGKLFCHHKIRLRFTFLQLLTKYRGFNK